MIKICKKFYLVIYSVQKQAPPIIIYWCLPYTVCYNNTRIEKPWKFIGWVSRSVLIILHIFMFDTLCMAISLDANSGQGPYLLFKWLTCYSPPLIGTYIYSYNSMLSSCKVLKLKLVTAGRKLRFLLWST